MEYITCFLMGIGLAAVIYCKTEIEFKVGDIIYLKPTGQKCIIDDYRGDKRWFLKDMDGNPMNKGFAYHQGLFDKIDPNVQ